MVNRFGEAARRRREDLERIEAIKASNEGEGIGSLTDG